MIAGALCLALIASGCATGVSRPLGKCSSASERRPVNPQRWPGGLKQIQGLVAEGEVKQAPPAAPTPAPARQTARPANQAVTPEPAPLIAPEPLPTPRSLEINPTTPTSDQRAQAPARQQIVEVECNG